MYFYYFEKINIELLRKNYKNHFFLFFKEEVMISKTSLNYLYFDALNVDDIFSLSFFAVDILSIFFPIMNDFLDLLTLLNDHRLHL